MKFFSFGLAIVFFFAGIHHTYARPRQKRIPLCGIKQVAQKRFTIIGFRNRDPWNGGSRLETKPNVNDAIMELETMRETDECKTPIEEELFDCKVERSLLGSFAVTYSGDFVRRGIPISEVVSEEQGNALLAELQDAQICK